MGYHKIAYIKMLVTLSGLLIDAGHIKSTNKEGGHIK